MDADATLTAIGACFVAGVLLHNLEEAIMLPAWSNRAGRWHRPVGRAEFTFAVSVLSLLLVLVAAGAYVAGAHTLWADLFIGYVVAMLANVFVPHVLATLATRRVMPGTATAVLLNLPLGTAFIRQALRTGFVDVPTLLRAGAMVTLMLVAAIPALLAIGRRIRSADG